MARMKRYYTVRGRWLKDSPLEDCGTFPAGGTVSRVCETLRKEGYTDIRVEVAGWFERTNP